MTLLIVGGAGYIGSIVNKRLAQNGYQTIVLDNLLAGHRDAVVAGELIVGDFGNRSDLRALFSRYPIEAVIHLGALTSVGESVTHPALYYENNVCKTLVLLEEMVDHDVLRLVFSSSAAVYGSPESVPVREEDRKEPINPYGRTKWIIEQMLSDFDHAYALRSCSLRYFNAAGGDPEGEIPDERTHPANLIPIVMRSILGGHPVVSIFGTDYETPDGSCIRDYIHVWDLATAHLLALEKLISRGYTCAYNLGNGTGFSVRQVVDSIARVTGQEIRVEEVARRAGDPARLIANADRAREELGWQPQYPELDTIVAHSWQAICASVR